MSQKKYRISQIDFLPQTGKFKIGAKDKEGNELHLGDIVSNESGEKYFIGYRYGDYMAKQPHTIHSIIPRNWDHFSKINEMWGVLNEEWIIIGYTDDHLYESIKDIPDLDILTPSN